MAELRTIQRTEIRDMMTMSCLLPLDDRFKIIPHPMSSLQAQSSEADRYILVVGPTGLYLMSYHLMEPQRQHSPPHFMDMARELEQAADFLHNYLCLQCPFIPPFHLYMIVHDRSIEGPATARVAFVPGNKLRKYLQEEEEQPLSGDQVNLILDVLRANYNFQRILRYQILAELDKTEQQTTYLAMDIPNDKPVTLKEIWVSYDPQNMDRHALIRGAKLAKELDHENIIRIETVYQQDDRCFIVTEWCESGITLKQYLQDQRGQIPLTVAIQLIKDLCRALMYAHDKGIIHRNLSPDNLIITREHRLKVSNFNLAKKSGMQTLQGKDLKRLVTENPYAAPESILDSAQMDQRFDVYSVGVIFYELLTGKCPNHYKEELWEPPSQLIAGLPAYMDILISKAIRFDKNQRYSTVYAFYSALEKGAVELLQGRYLLRSAPSSTLTANAPLYHETADSLLFAALDTQTQTQVAIRKLLVPAIYPRQQRLEILQAQLQALKPFKELHHDNLALVLDVFMEDDDAYVVREWLDARSLADVVATVGQKLSFIEVRAIAAQIAESLQYLHQEGYVYGGLTLDKVLYTEERQVLLLEHPLQSRNAVPSHHLSQPAMSLDDEQTDVFMLGCLLYTLIAAREPYTWHDGKFVLTSSSLSLFSYEPTIPPDLERLVLKAVALAPDERHLTMTHLLTELYATPDAPSLLGIYNHPRHRYRIMGQWWPTACYIGVSLLVFWVYQYYWSRQFADLALPILEEKMYE